MLLCHIIFPGYFEKKKKTVLTQTKIIVRIKMQRKPVKAGLKITSINENVTISPTIWRDFSKTVKNLNLRVSSFIARIIGDVCYGTEQRVAKDCSKMTLSSFFQISSNFFPISITYQALFHDKFYGLIKIYPSWKKKKKGDRRKSVFGIMDYDKETGICTYVFVCM